MTLHIDGHAIGTRARSHDPALLAVDVETTGLDPERDAILELAYVIQPPGTSHRGARIRWSTCIYPGRDVHADPAAQAALRVNGITRAELAGAPCWDDVAASLVCLLQGSHVVVGHNALAFDLPFITAHALRGVRPWRPRCQVIDTQQVWKAREPGVRHRLVDATERFMGRPHTGAHRALADAEAALDVALAQLDEWGPGIVEVYG